VRSNLFKEFERFTKLDIVKNISKRVNTYEKRVRGLVDDLDLSSFDAKVEGRKQLNKFQKQLKQTRRDLEGRVGDVIQKESKRINTRYNELVSILKTLSDGATTKRPRKKTKRKAKLRRKKKSSRTTRAATKKAAPGSQVSEGLSPA